MVMKIIKLILLLNSDFFFICIDKCLGACKFLIIVNIVIGLVGEIKVLKMM